MKSKDISKFFRKGDRILNHLRKWFQISNPLNGRAYALIGFIAFGIKYTCDVLLAKLIFHRTWHLWDYVRGSNAFYLWDLQKQDAFFFASMLALAIPFMALGVTMTLRRLNTLKLSPWLVLIFFIPFINVPFLLGLACMQTSTQDTGLPYHWPTRKGIGALIPESGLASSLVAFGLTGILVTAAVALNSTTFKYYGWGLFVFLPFIQGLLAAWLYGYHRPHSFGECWIISMLSCGLAGIGLIAFALEGAICIVMASPLWLGVATVGAYIGSGIQEIRWRSIDKNLSLLLCVCAIPFLMGAEFAIRPPVPLLRATSTIDIHASSETVWRHVVAFSDLPPPKEWVFETGLAFPVRARIQGRGVGAIRHCEFSTGIFVEPIEIWNEPLLLRFSVTNTPAPMEEMSLYSHIEPPHLHGYMVSKEGQFLLKTLPDGSTRLEGTTWYEHNLWPASYWQLWSNYIIHQIHMRVLRHIKTLAENEQQNRDAYHR